MKKSYWFIMATVAVCLCVAAFFSPSFGIKNEPDKVMQNDEARVMEIIKGMLDDYRSKNLLLLGEFEQSLEQTGNTGFSKAKANVGPFVSSVTKFTYCSKLCYAMAKDKYSNTGTAMDMLAPSIASMIVAPCEEGQAEVINALNDFLLKVQENDTQFKAGLASLLNKENFTVHELGLREDFLKKNITLMEKVQDFAMEQMAAAAGTAIEIVFIKATYKCISSATSAIAGRITASAVAGGTCAAADGPLPIGDIIGGVLAVGGMGWTAYDLYNVTKKLPSQMETYMLAMIDSYQRDSRRLALERAREIIQLCAESSEEISASVEKKPETAKESNI